MKKPDVQRAFHACLEQPLAEHGFQLRKSDHVYLHKDGDITCFFDVAVYAMIQQFLVRPTVFVGSEQVNRLFAAATGRPFKARDYTCGFAVHNETSQQKGTYWVEAAEQIPGVASAVLRDFEEFAVPFHARYASIAGIDSYLNLPRKDRAPNPSISGACLGLVAAHLSGRPDVATLAAQYQEFWSVAQGPKLAALIGQTADHLRGATPLT